MASGLHGLGVELHLTFPCFTLSPCLPCFPLLSLATRGQGLARPGPNPSLGHGLGDGLPGPLQHTGETLLLIIWRDPPAQPSHWSALVPRSPGKPMVSLTHPHGP